MSAPSKCRPIHDSPTVLLATLFAARRSGDAILERLMLRRLIRLGIAVQFVDPRPRKGDRDAR